MRHRLHSKIQANLGYESLSPKGIITVIVGTIVNTHKNVKGRWLVRVSGTVFAWPVQGDGVGP